MLNDRPTLTALRWCAKLGPHTGYLGPTVQKSGPLPELVPAVEAGLLRLSTRSLQRGTARLGYFITAKGVAHLARQTPAILRP